MIFLTALATFFPLCSAISIISAVVLSFMIKVGTIVEMRKRDKSLLFGKNIRGKEYLLCFNSMVCFIYFIVKLRIKTKIPEVY